MIRRLSSPMEIRCSGLRSKIFPRISFRSSDNGSIAFKKSRSRVNALYVESSHEACFHGLRPQVRLTRITPRDQISLGAHRYDGLLEAWSRHSEEIEMVSGKRGVWIKQGAYLETCKMSSHNRGPQIRHPWLPGQSQQARHQHLSSILICSPA